MAAVSAGAARAWPARQCIERAGGRYLGEQTAPALAGPLLLFQDPITRTTLAMREAEISVASVRERLARAREMFAPGRALAAAECEARE